MATGRLQVRITTQIILPVAGAQILITEADTSLLLEQKTVYTDNNGLTDYIELETVDRELSLDPDNTNLPYRTYNLFIFAKGFILAEALGVNIFDSQDTLQWIDLLPRPANYGSDFELDSRKEETHKQYDVQPHAKEGEQRVLQRVVIPENITVHLGAPNSSARNVTVPFRTYLKSVAASEIYPTWPQQALRANIYAQISFVLNRIFTEWYPSRGYDFNITNSPSYDQKYVHNRSTFETTDAIVEEIFNEYIVKPGRIDPFFAEYCDGRSVTCKGMSQWGSKADAERGMSAIAILRKYYGNDVRITESNNIASIPVSYPGSALREGATGESVRVIQAQLNRIADDYPSIGKVNVDGVFGATTTAAVRRFQQIFDLTADGVVGKRTWYKISYIYVSVKKLAQLTSEGEAIQDGSYPGRAYRRGDRGINVQIIQFYLNQTAVYVNSIKPVVIDGNFGAATEASVREFQEYFNLTQDGVVGQATWEKMQDIYEGIQEGVDVPEGTPPSSDAYPGTPLRIGSRGANVTMIQNWLNALSVVYPDIPSVSADGIFGPLTQNAVLAFQSRFNLTADGIVGRVTWNRLYTEWQNLVAEGQA
ncbi:MAG: peptidoglycan-binding protein [Oscillospiraceae bacterium]|nr:peptidoglycan-binding protein [Oscillospiraceae bacterium]